MKRTITGLALISILVFAATAWSQDSPKGHGKMEMGESSDKKACMQMMAKMEASNAALDELVEQMQAAEGADKVPAMEEVLVTLVAQRREMHKRMKKMPQMMCGGMMMMK